MESKALTPEKAAEAERRTAKKAARRAAFIQEVAQAVVAALAPAATPDTTAPFAAAYAAYASAELRADWEQQQATDALWWGKHVGLLPEHATELPSEEVQRYLLTTLNARSKNQRPVEA